MPILNLVFKLVRGNALYLPFKLKAHSWTFLVFLGEEYRTGPLTICNYRKTVPIFLFFMRGIGTIIISRNQKIKEIGKKIERLGKKHKLITR